jgi:hypothetical protein
MNPTIVGMIVFGCTFGGALLAMWLRTTLPEHHLDKDSRDTVKTSIGLIATMTALVLGLVTASAKSSFDAVDTAVKQTAAELLALDRVLARYGSETRKIRKGLQDTIRARIDIVWPQRSFKPVSLDTLASGAWLVETERFADAIKGLKPQHDSQRALQKRALDLTEALLQARWLVTDETEASIPVPFLVVLLCWLTIIFASFGLVAPRNATVVTVLFVCALSVGSALFLILEMDGPFDGLLKVSPGPLRYALEHLNQ